MTARPSASTAAPEPTPASASVLESALEGVATHADTAPVASAAALLDLGEQVLELWIAARGETPTREAREGFRLLALHRQGAKGEPSFNACRETCRELVYHHNLITLDPAHPATPQRLILMTMVARHLILFVTGKMQVAGLGEFCCASKPVRAESDA